MKTSKLLAAGVFLLGLTIGFGNVSQALAGGPNYERNPGYINPWPGCV